MMSSYRFEDYQAICSLCSLYNKTASVVEGPPGVQEVSNSIERLLIPNTLKIVVMASLLGAHGCVVSITTDLLDVRLTLSLI